MDEFELLRKATVDPAEDDEIAKASAREQLYQAIARERSASPTEARVRKGARRQTRLWLIGAVAAVALVAIVVQALLPLGNGGPAASAANELIRLGTVAASRASLELRPGKFLYSEVETQARRGTTTLGGGPPYTIVVRDTVRTWLAADGSGRRLTTTNSVRFLSKADEAAWRSAGSPPIPQSGAITREHFRPTGLPLYNVGSLPTDPGRLLTAIRAGDVVAAPEDDASLLLSIGTLLAQGNASPGLRQALFEVVSRVPSANLDAGAVDPIGRPGIGVLVSQSGSIAELIFDPNTSELLSLERRAPNTPTTDWQAFVKQATVSSITARPKSSS